MGIDGNTFLTPAKESADRHAWAMSNLVNFCPPTSHANKSSIRGIGWESVYDTLLTDYGRGCTGQLNFELRYF